MHHYCADAWCLLCKDAYAGQNTKIRDTLNNLILKSPQNWQTTVGLPFFQIEGTVSHNLGQRQL